MHACEYEYEYGLGITFFQRLCLTENPYKQPGTNLSRYQASDGDKMNVLGSTSANQGDVIQVDLPTNSIVDLSSLAWSYNIAYSAAALADGKKAGCPINAESIIVHTSSAGAKPRRAMWRFLR